MKYRKVASRKNRFPGLMNKKGFIRIIEAIFAILLIMGAVLILISNNLQNSNISEEVYEKQKYILEVISNDEAIRDQIILGNTELTNNFITQTLPNSWKFLTCITEAERICSPPNIPKDKEIYVSETIISSSLSSQYSGAKKLRFFIWIE